MKQGAGIILSLVVLLLAAHEGFAQRKATPVAVTPVVVPPPPVDVAVLREQAEQGSAQAQLALANHLVADQRPVEALEWYRKAAAKWQVEAYYQIGNMLLYGAGAGDAEQQVAPEPASGFRWTFRAATNLHAKAMLNMSRALGSGLGSKTNLIEAYAWMHLFAERDPGSGRVELTNLTQQLDPATIQEGQKLAKLLKDRQWANLSMMKMAQLASTLRLEGVTAGGLNPLAVINRRTLNVGETAEVPVRGGTIQVKCLEIQANSVMILVADEDEPRLLRFGTNLAARAAR